MAHVASVLVRRAVDVTNSHLNDGSDNEDHPLKEMAFGGIVVIGLTVILYLAVISAVRLQDHGNDDLLTIPD